MLSRALLLAVAALVAAFLACVLGAAAQSYPTRPVTIIVPYAAGGTTDVIARELGRRLEQRLGQPFIVEYKPGAASAIGAGYVARATPDGYTILLGTSTTMAINVSIYKNLSYDPTRDLVPIALVAGVPFMLVVNPALPIRTIPDFVNVARSNARGLTYASNGAGGAAHLFAELLKGTLGIGLTHVPYKGLAPALNDIVGGHVDTMFTDFATALPLVRDGKLRAIGVSTAARVGPAPDIPALAQVGLPGFDASSWQMMIAPAKTPRPIVDRLNSELNAIMSDPATQRAFADRGHVPLTGGSSEQLARFVKSEIARWGEVVTRAGAAGIE